jgi:hypothetical protein
MQQQLGYADIPQVKVQASWLASFKASPPESLSESFVQIKNGDIPIDTSICAALSSTSIPNSPKHIWPNIILNIIL